MSRSSRLIAFALAVALAFVAGACAGHLTPKVQIDRADRVAFESLRGFQLAETAAFRAGLPWPTDAVHRQINAKLSSAYALVIDVANVGLSLQPGQALPADVRASLAALTQAVADILALVAPSAGAEIQTTATAAQRSTATLVTTIQNGATP